MKFLADLYMRFPCLVGALSTSFTTAGSWLFYYHILTGLIGFITLGSSIVTAIFTALVAYRQWRRGAEEKREKKSEAATRRKNRPQP